MFSLSSFITDLSSKTSEPGLSASSSRLMQQSFCLFGPFFIRLDQISDFSESAHKQSFWLRVGPPAPLTFGCAAIEKQKLLLHIFCNLLQHSQMIQTASTQYSHIIFPNQESPRRYCFKVNSFYWPLGILMISNFIAWYCILLYSWLRCTGCISQDAYLLHNINSYE